MLLPSWKQLWTFIQEFRSSLFFIFWRMKTDDLDVLKTDLSDENKLSKYWRWTLPCEVIFSLFCSLLAQLDSLHIIGELKLELEIFVNIVIFNDWTCQLPVLCYEIIQTEEWEERDYYYHSDMKRTSRIWHLTSRFSPRFCVHSKFPRKFSSKFRNSSEKSESCVISYGYV